MADWSCLHSDMLMLVARCLKEVRDHLRFAAVCSSWRSVALEFRPTFPRPVPGLMLHGSKSRPFFSLAEKRHYNDKIHLLDDEDVCLGSHGGWLFIMHQNLDISLFNPFSRERLPLPPVTSFPKLGEAYYTVNHEFYVLTAAFSCRNINLAPADATVMVVEGGFRRLAFAKPGDSSWRIIDNDPWHDDPGTHFTGVVFYKDEFYAVNGDKTVVCDIRTNPGVTSIAESPSHNLSYYPGKRYLVELMGELVLVVRFSDSYVGNEPIDYVSNQGDEVELDIDEDDVGFTEEELGLAAAVDGMTSDRTMFFSVYKMDFSSHRWVPMNDLRKNVIFVGCNSAFSMPVWDCEEGDCIYFTDDREENFGGWRRKNSNFGYDMGVFSVKAGVVKHYIGKKKKLFPPPMWVNYIPW